MSLAVAPLPAASEFPTSLAGELPVGVVLLDEGGRITLANARAYALLAPVNPVGLLLAEVARALAADDDAGAPASGTLVGLPRVPSPDPVSVTTKQGRVLSVTARGLSGGGSVACVDDVTHHRRAGEAEHRDGLTDLHSRKAFDERLRSHLAVIEREGGEAALLCLDLDRFKLVNDTLGHPIGDALLRMVAGRLRSAVREGDVVARLGGDEFAVLQVGGEQPRAAAALAQRLVDLVGRTYVADGHLLNIGASVGVALIPRDGRDADLVARNADLALYRAKADGRGTYRLFEPEMDARMQARRSLEIDLRRALALKEFELAYQPQTRLEGDALVGFEALLRWRHPERGVVSPADFIPLAEEIGLMPMIGEWVLRTACREAVRWPEDISVAVNISAVQFRGARLVEAVVSALAGAGLAPPRLELEITESALLDNTEAVLDVLKALRSLGVRVSMDDFGTGYSSLSYLQKFPFDKIKIDQSFVRGQAGDKDGAAIVRAVAGLGASLGMTTVAEGVETPEQLARIQAEGCTQAQGYLISRPLPPEAARAFIAARTGASVPSDPETSPSTPSPSTTSPSTTSPSTTTR